MKLLIFFFAGKNYAAGVKRLLSRRVLGLKRELKSEKLSLQDFLSERLKIMPGTIFGNCE
ncbi:hypothetical protein [Microcoleus sp. FACHB-68]|uniref:hypothetical protein n=1 Tax=Microcoleus sp. FACHB-68 TaxID=2692826 RepID=UPI001685D115|nr:hypothetical protein [Microcoleus sp. FACHB-68]MBD1939194.1 hypothetical protein [Microcoleus sp. FACHB-68]